MVNAIINTLTDKEFDSLLELSSPAGRKMLISALRAEISLENFLFVDYPTAELRKISAKIQRGREVSAEEKFELQRSTPIFLGKRKQGGNFESPASIAYLEDYLRQLPLYKRNVERSNRLVEEGNGAEKLLLGVSISRLRSNSIFFSDFVKSNLHIYPKEVTRFLRELIEEIIDAKNGAEPIIYRLPVDEVQQYLLADGITYSHLVEMYNRASGVPLHKKEEARMESIFIKLIKEAATVDAVMKTTPELTSSFELLHDKHAIFFLHYLYHFLKEPLKKKIRVSHNTLLTFYRKGVELCGNL